MEAAAEFDNRPGPVRDLVAETMGMWMALLVEQAERALERGELAPGTDPAQLAWELHAFGLALNWDHQLNGASLARGRAATAVRARLEAAATPKGRRRLARTAGTAAAPRPPSPAIPTLGAMAEGAVLLVDDDAPILRMLERTLGAEGYTVVAVADGGSALAAVERSLPDVIVLDVAMPGLDGLAVTRRLRAKGLAVPILLLTARDAIEERVAGLDAGADDYVVKPFDVSELDARVRALMRRNHPPGEQLAFADLTLDAESGTARRGAGASISPAARPSCWS